MSEIEPHGAVRLTLPILPQPDDVTCGPTSLHAVYQYYGYAISLEQLIRETSFLRGGGTLAVLLGLDALKRGFAARLFSYNLHVFDPSWSDLNRRQLMAKLQEQLEHKDSTRIREASMAYIQFLEHGGEIYFDELRPALIRRYLKNRVPILTGLSATYLYNCMREFETGDDQSIYDDVRGAPTGHFVVLSGYEEGRVIVADPYKGNPLSDDQHYRVDIRRLIHSILMGIVTYDANLLVIQPKDA